MGSRDVRGIVEGLVPFAAAGLLFGLLYNTLFYPRTLVEYTESGMIGVLLGIMAGVVELTLGRRWFELRSFLQAMAIRTVGYSLAVALVVSVVLAIEPAALGECAYTDCLRQFVTGPLFLRDLAFSTAFVFLATFTAQLVLLVGTRNFGRLMLGRYRRPRDLDAVFMFVDVRSSTAIAESLGHERYSALLRDFFTDVSRAIHHTRGEVYQYVGDEVVVVWPGRRSGAPWIDCFTQMRAAIDDAAPRYEAAYGLVPQFKAGVHSGEVVVTEVGTLQRAHVYHGDVLNAAARIQAECNAAGFDLLVSAAALSSAPAGVRDRFTSLGPLELRGRSEAVEVFAFLDARTDGVAEG